MSLTLEQILRLGMGILLALSAGWLLWALLRVRREVHRREAWHHHRWPEDRESPE